MLSQTKVGVLLINTGSPDAPEASSVKKYLAEFLSDKRIIELPSWKWQPILRGIILITRPKSSAERYKLIWDDVTGSPLIHYTERLLDKLNACFEEDSGKVKLYYAMRYGNPSVKDVLDKMLDSGIEKILVFPMFAQFATQTSAACTDAVFKYMLQSRKVPAIRTIRDYYLDSGYIEALKSHILKYWSENGSAIDFGGKLVISFHGIPEDCVEKGDKYPQYCIDTAKALAQSLGLKDSEWVYGFQSRFGKAEWIKPYTLPLVRELARNGVSRLDVICPGFSMDCLETIEEIGDEMKREFLEAIPEKNKGAFHYIPCLNDSVEAVIYYKSLIEKELTGWI